jgi:hypothetical protein
LEKETKKRMPKGARYPTFLLGLVVLIVGGLIAQMYGMPVTVDITIGLVGFILLLLSVVIP